MSSSYYEYKQAHYSCSNCGWHGLGSHLKQGDMFEHGAEFHCPACGEYFGFVMWPTTQEWREHKNEATVYEQMILEELERRTAAGEAWPGDGGKPLPAWLSKLAWTAALLDAVKARDARQAR